ncbi:glycoside hydrolase family 38 N-terminal domain-containing protein [Fervidibacter sacchari]
MLLLALLLFQSPQEVYYAWGWHGGYYLTNEVATREAFDRLFNLLDALPHIKAVFEIEPYTLERMLHGEKFGVERMGRDQPQLVGWQKGGVGRWEFAIGAEFARKGKLGVRLVFHEGEYAHICQPMDATKLRGKTLVFSGHIRSQKGMGAHLYIDAWDERGFIAGSSRMSERIPADGKWHFVNFEWVVPQNAVTIFPQAKIAFEPTVADFDDLSLKVKETGEELLANGDLERVELPTLKDPQRLARLRKFVKEGRVEIVGGAYTQPIMFTIGDESVVRQFVLGCKAVEEAIGVSVKIYAAQEPDMIGQLPQILSKLGFRGVLYRTQWGAFGFTPSYDAEVVKWLGPDGTAIDCIPLPEPMRSGWGLHSPSPRVVQACAKRDITKPLFTFFGDFIASWFAAPDDPRMKGIFAEGWANLCKRLDAVSLRGKQLELSAWVRTKFHGAHIYIDAHNQLGIATSGTQSSNAVPDGKWQRLKVTFRVPNDAVYIFPQCRIISDYCEADFDDVSLRVVDTGEELLPDGSFEGDGLPTGWSVASSEGVEREYSLVIGDAPDGKRFVRLKAKMPSVKVTFVTLNEYFEVAGKPTKIWHDAFANFEHRFPYGLLAGRPQRADRLAEDEALKVERICAIATWGRKLVAQERRKLSEMLDDIWRLILIGQHHDAWVCAPVIFGIWAHGFKTYAELTLAASEEARKLCEAALKSIGIERNGAPKSSEFIVLNVCGFERSEVLPYELELPKGLVRNPLLARKLGSKVEPIPATCEVIERHDDGSAKRVKGWLLAQVLPIGYIRFTVVERSGKAKALNLPEAKVTKVGESVALENQFVRLLVGRDGLLEAFFPDGRKLTSEPMRIVGRFETGDAVARVESVEGFQDGPIAVARAKCRIAHVPFEMRVSLSPTSPIVRISLDFDFGEKTVVGVGEPIPEGPHPQIPVWARDDLKLRLMLPLNMKAPKFLGHGAFELRRPTEMRLPILRCAIAHDGDWGVAIYPDRATVGLFDDKRGEMGIVLAYGGSFIYAPNEFAPLTGKERFEIGLNFFKGSVEGAMVVQHAEGFAQPLMLLPATSKIPFEADEFPLVKIEPESSAVISAIYPSSDGIVVRLWRPYDGEAKVRLQISGAKSVWLADLFGKPQRQLAKGGTANIELKCGEIVTLLARD